MMPPYSTHSLRQSLLEDVLEEYMRRLDHGEVIDRDEFLAQHPELADELRSYFAGTDEVARLHRPPARQTPGLSLTCGLLETGASPPASREGRRVGEYELLEQIGYGGMGVIYKARQLRLERLVAVKMIRPDRLASPADILRFQSEAEAAAGLEHPNITPIYEVGEHEGEHYFSMKLIEGGSLAQHLPRLAADLPAGVSLLTTVTRAIHYAHQRGLLHRDLKPANILLDAEGRPYVTDFGLAKRLLQKPGEASLTQQGMIVGTPCYMAPEQASNQAAVSTAADVYSLGAILYELLTGRPPFRGSTPLDTLVQLREQEPAAPRSVNKRVDRDLETVCLKCLHKETTQRYPSAAALADDLERWRRGEPIQARPVGRCRRALKWARRQPVLATVLTLLVIVFWTGFAGVLWQWRRAVESSRRAVESSRHAVESSTAARQTGYARGIGLSYADWHAGNAGSAERVLSECPAELRGWEWHYLRRLFRVRQLATLHGHDKAVLAVAFSPDGSRMASAGADGVVVVWDRQSLRAVLTLPGHAAAVTAVVFSPDGRRLASGSADGSLRLWDTSSGEAMATWNAHAGAVSGLAFDPTGRRLASTGRGQPGWGELKKHLSPFDAFRERLKTGNGQPAFGELKLWDASNGQVLNAKTWNELLAAVAFSPDGRLLTAGHDGQAVAWDANTLKDISTLEGQNARKAVTLARYEKRDVRCTGVAISADGQWVGSSSSNGVVRVWTKSARQQTLISRELLTPTQVGVSALAFSGRDGCLVLAADDADNTIRAWFTKTGRPAFTLRGHHAAVTSVACSPDGTCLVSGSRDRTVKLWDLCRRDDDLTLRASEGYASIAFSPAGDYLASAPRDKAVLMWDLTTAKAVVRWRGLSESVNGLAFSPDGAQLACAEDDGTICVREVPFGRERLHLRGHNDSVRAVAFRFDGNRLASAGADGTVRIWDMVLGREELCLTAHDGAVHAVAFSPDGSRVASAGADGVVRLWNAGTGRQLLALADHDGPVYAVAFRPDGRRLATAGEDEVVRVWDAARGDLIRKLLGHTGTVRSLAYGPEGRLASAGDDMAVRVWDTAGHELLALRGHTKAIRAVTFSRDGCRLATASDDLTIKVWDGTPLEETNARQK